MATRITADDVLPLMKLHSGARGMKQLRQALPMMDAGARVDMGWEKWKVAVEFDGAQHWTDPLQRTKDIDRAAELERLGWRVIRVSYGLLRNRPDVVVARVREALRAAGCPLS